MIYGFVVIQTRLKCDWENDYQEDAQAKLIHVRLFANKKERDNAAMIAQRKDWSLTIEKFVTKSNQGKLKITNKYEKNESRRKVKTEVASES